MISHLTNIRLLKNPKNTYRVNPAGDVEELPSDDNFYKVIDVKYEDVTEDTRPNESIVVNGDRLVLYDRKGKIVVFGEKKSYICVKA